MLKHLLFFFLLVNNLFLKGMDFCRESPEEFIKRTQQLPRSNHYSNAVFNHFVEPVGAHNSFYVMCPFNRDCAILRPADHTLKSQCAMITPQDDVYIRHFLGKKNIIALALSGQREMFAIIEQSSASWYNDNICNVLKIKSVNVAKTIQKIKIPKTFEVASCNQNGPAIAFNKQNTDIIVWGVDTTKRKSCKHNLYGIPATDYTIYPICFC